MYESVYREADLGGSNMYKGWIKEENIQNSGRNAAIWDKAYLEDVREVGGRME